MNIFYGQMRDIVLRLCEDIVLRLGEDIWTGEAQRYCLEEYGKNIWTDERHMGM